MSKAQKHLDPGMKMGWAKHHLEILNGEVFKYRANEPYAISIEDDLQAGEVAVRLKIAPVPAIMGLIVGDWVACLRGALDHLAYALTTVNGGTPNEKVSFPVIGVKNSSGQKSFHQATNGITPKAVPVIESLQPYQSGINYKSTELWRLHRLWNIDKHRRIPFHATMGEIVVGAPYGFRPRKIDTHEGGELRFPLSVKSQLATRNVATIAIQFGDESEGVIVSYEEMFAIHDFVLNKVMPNFGRFF